MSIEFPDNIKVLLDSWNMKTNVWLRECVYKRVTPKGKKPGFRSSIITFATSAFWVRFLLLPTASVLFDLSLIKLCSMELMEDITLPSSLAPSLKPLVDFAEAIFDLFSFLPITSPCEALLHHLKHPSSVSTT